MIKYMKQPILRSVRSRRQMLFYPSADRLNFCDFIILHEEEVFCVLGSVVLDEVSFYAVLTQHTGVGYIVANKVLAYSDIIF